MYLFYRPQSTRWRIGAYVVDVIHRTISFKEIPKSYRGVEADVGVGHQVQNRNDLKENVERVAAEQVIQAEWHPDAKHVIMIVVTPKIMMVAVAESKPAADAVVQR